MQFKLISSFVIIFFWAPSLHVTIRTKSTSKNFTAEANPSSSPAKVGRSVLSNRRKIGLLVSLRGTIDALFMRTNENVC